LESRKSICAYNDGFERWLQASTDAAQHASNNATTPVVCLRIRMVNHKELCGICHAGLEIVLSYRFFDCRK
jgi:hypothetical protein